MNNIYPEPVAIILIFGEGIEQKKEFILQLEDTKTKLQNHKSTTLELQKHSQLSEVSQNILVSEHSIESLTKDKQLSNKVDTTLTKSTTIAEKNYTVSNKATLGSEITYKTQPNNPLTSMPYQTHARESKSSVLNNQLAEKEHTFESLESQTEQTEVNQLGLANHKGELPVASESKFSFGRHGQEKNSVTEINDPDTISLLRGPHAKLEQLGNNIDSDGYLSDSETTPVNPPKSDILSTEDLLKITRNIQKKLELDTFTKPDLGACAGPNQLDGVLRHLREVSEKVGISGSENKPVNQESQIRGKGNFNTHNMIGESDYEWEMFSLNSDTTKLIASPEYQDLLAKDNEERVKILQETLRKEQKISYKEQQLKALHKQHTQLTLSRTHNDQERSTTSKQKILPETQSIEALNKCASDLRENIRQERIGRQKIMQNTKDRIWNQYYTLNKQMHTSAQNSISQHIKQRNI